MRMYRFQPFAHPILAGEKQAIGVVVKDQ